MAFKNLTRPRVPTSDPSQIGGSRQTETSPVDAKECSSRKPAFSARRLAYQALARVPGQIHHRRHVSTPQPLPPSTNPQNNFDEAVAKGFGSPPIIGFTQFNDTYREPRNGVVSKGTSTALQSATTSDAPRPILKRNAHSSREILLNSESMVSSQPASERKPDPRIIIPLLSAILDCTQLVEHHLNIHDLLGQHQLDQLDFEERSTIRATMKEGRKLQLRGQKGELGVFNEPLRRASLYASTTMILGGREHELPILVASCVEELYRTGIYQSNLFRTLPNRSRLFELINIFDSEEQPPGSIIRTHKQPKYTPPRSTGFGADTSLHLESTPDICALLSMYLSSLPQPIMIPSVFRALWDWCAMEEDRITPSQGEEPFRHQLSSIPLSRSYTSPVETSHILKAQLLLHLLPSPNFSLLLYLLAFFSQAALIREENGVGIEDLGKMFGGPVFGGEMLPPASKQVPFGGAQHHVAGGPDVYRQGEVMMCWFLRRWGPISDGLFEVIDEAKVNSLLYKGHSGVRTPAQTKSASSGSEGSSGGGSDSFAITRIAGRDSPFPFARRRRNTTAPGDSPGVLPPGREEMRPISFGYELNKDLKMGELPRSHSTPKRHYEHSDEVSKKDEHRDIFKDTDYVILAHSSPRLSSDSKSVDIGLQLVDNSGLCPTVALEDRLMDITMPALLNQTLPKPEETSIEASHLSGLEARLTLTPGLKTEEAIMIIKRLEDQLKISNNRLRTTTAEVFSLRSKCSTLEGKVRRMEQLLESRAGRGE